LRSKLLSEANILYTEDTPKLGYNMEKQNFPHSPLSVPACAEDRPTHATKKNIKSNPKTQSEFNCFCFFGLPIAVS
jgi:hypothetical protein